MYPLIKKFGLRCALFALLLNVMWPLIANANPTKPLTLMLCTSTGMKPANLAQIEQSAPAGLPSSEHPNNHCPLCLTIGMGPDVVLPSAEATHLRKPLAAVLISLIKSTDFITARAQLRPPSHAPPG